MKYAAAVRTDIGRKRLGNEDSFCVAPDMGLFVVADGMGGHAAGEVASRLAVDTIREWVARFRPRDGAPRDVSAACLADSIQAANRAVFEAAQAQPECSGMGTTVVSVLAVGRRVILAHVGDSRIYRIRADGIMQLSRDHSVVQEQLDRGLLTPEEAAVSRYRHLITRALGLQPSVEVEVQDLPWHAGDILLLCSDGLSDMLEAEDIFDQVRRHRDDLWAACGALVEQANARGGADNITVLLVQAAEVGELLEQDHQEAPTLEIPEAWADTESTLG
jgi:serine/threonine protein phosphatase PrpC